MKSKLISALVALGFLAASAMATTTNDLTGAGSGALPAGLKTPVVMSGTASFTTTAAGALDVYKVIIIPSNSVVKDLWYKIVSTNASAAVVHIGDSTLSNRYATAVDMQGVAGTCAFADSVGTFTNRQYTSKDYIAVKAAGAITAGSIQVKAVIVPFE